MPRRRRAGDVDGVVAGAGADDQRQPAGVEHRRRHFRAAHDEHVRAARRDRLRQRVVLQIRLVDAPRSRRPPSRPSMPLFSNLSATRTFMTRDRARALISCGQQPVAQLRLEPGGLGRHDAPFVRDRHQVVDRDGVHRERHRGLAARSPPLERRGAARAADEVDALVGPHVADVRAAARARGAAAARRRARSRASRPRAPRSTDPARTTGRRETSPPLPCPPASARRREPARRCRSASRNCAGVGPARSLTVRL